MELNIRVAIEITPMNLLLENWCRQKEVFINNLAIIRDRPTKTSVHDLRVSVKKIRAYLRLSEKISGNKWKSSFSTVAALYKSAGRLSDFDISFACILKRLKTNEAFTNFKEYLSANRAVTRKWTKETATAFNEKDLDALEQFFKLELTDVEITKKIIQFSKARLKTAKDLMNHLEKNVHKLRKLLKDVCNWAKIGQKELIDEFINIKALDNMLKHLGNWQDLFVLKEKTTEYQEEIVIDTTEKEVLDDLQNELTQSQKRELDLALRKWKNVEI